MLTAEVKFNKSTSFLRVYLSDLMAIIIVIYHVLFREKSILLMHTLREKTKTKLQKIQPKNYITTHKTCTQTNAIQQIVFIFVIFIYIFVYISNDAFGR